MDTATETFESHRPLLFGIAYRMTGAAAESEDLVQDTFLRWQKVDLSEIESPKAYLSTIVTRLALDYMKSARVRRETYVGPWLPEPVTGAAGPDEVAAMADSVSVAFLLLLERLTPVERAAFLLHEIFDIGYDEIADMLEKTEVNCRQYVRRAKQHLAENKPRFDVTPERQRDLTERFLTACAMADTEGLTELLGEDAILYADGGGKVVSARNPIYGADPIARFLVGVARKAHPAERAAKMVELNGQLGCIVYADGAPENVFMLECGADLIQRVYVVRNPEKLVRLANQAL